jgi:hypothetical protein
MSTRLARTMSFTCMFVPWLFDKQGIGFVVFVGTNKCNKNGYAISAKKANTRQSMLMVCLSIN